MNERYPGRGHKLPHPPQERYTSQEIRQMVQETLERIDKGTTKLEDEAYQRHVDKTEGITY